MVFPTPTLIRLHIIFPNNTQLNYLIQNLAVRFLSSKTIEQTHGDLFMLGQTNRRDSFTLTINQPLLSYNGLFQPKFR